MELRMPVLEPECIIIKNTDMMVFVLFQKSWADKNGHFPYIWQAPFCWYSLRPTLKGQHWIQAMVP